METGAGPAPLTPERLDDEDAAQHHQADDVDCFFQGGSLAGDSETRPVFQSRRRHTKKRWVYEHSGYFHCAAPAALR